MDEISIVANNVALVDVNMDEININVKRVAQGSVYMVITDIVAKSVE
jgi:hypothetical protein